MMLVYVVISDNGSGICIQIVERRSCARATEGKDVRGIKRRVFKPLFAQASSDLSFSKARAKGSERGRVHRITSASKHGGRETLNKMERRESFKKVECYRCGKDHEAESCPYKKNVCHMCKWDIWQEHVIAARRTTHNSEHNR